MTHVTRYTPAIPLICPKCDKQQLLSIFAYITEIVVRCPRPCYESIKVCDQYRERRSELEDLAERLGMPGFWSAHDAVSKIEEEAFQSTCGGS